MLVTGTGAEDSMEMITTSTSGRDGGESRAKWKRTRRLCPSNTVTGNRLPAGRNGKVERGRGFITNLQLTCGQKHEIIKSVYSLGLMDSSGTKTSVRVTSAGGGSAWIGDVSNNVAPRLDWELRGGAGWSEAKAGMGFGGMLAPDMLWRSLRVGLDWCLSLRPEKLTHADLFWLYSANWKELKILKEDIPSLRTGKLH